MGIEDIPITPEGKGDCKDCNKAEFGCNDWQKGKLCSDYNKKSEHEKNLTNNHKSFARKRLSGNSDIWDWEDD